MRYESAGASRRAIVIGRVIEFSSEHTSTTPLDPNIMQSRKRVDGRLSDALRTRLPLADLEDNHKKGAIGGGGVSIFGTRYRSPAEDEVCV